MYAAAAAAGYLESLSWREASKCMRRVRASELSAARGELSAKTHVRRCCCCCCCCSFARTAVHFFSFFFLHSEVNEREEVRGTFLILFH